MNTTAGPSEANDAKPLMAVPASVTRVLATRGLGGDPGQQAKPETSQRAQQLHEAGPQPTPGSAEPPVRAGSERLRHRARTRPHGNPSGNVLRPLSLICQLAGTGGGNPTRRWGLRTCPRTLNPALSISWRRLGCQKAASIDVTAAPHDAPEAHTAA